MIKKYSTYLAAAFVAVASACLSRTIFTISSAVLIPWLSWHSKHLASESGFSNGEPEAWWLV